MKKLFVSIFVLITGICCHSHVAMGQQTETFTTWNVLCQGEENVCVEYEVPGGVEQIAGDATR